MHSRLLFILLSGMLALGMGTHCTNRREDSLSAARTLSADACRWLWAQQQPDGGWHSQVQGLLKNGEALTPFVLFALLQVPEDIYSPDKQAVARGLGFIRSHISERGAMEGADPLLLEYPNYATAYALRTLARFGTTNDSTLIQRMQQYLLAEQFTAGRGIEAASWVYGGWGFGERLKKGQYGHVDISHTRRILQALRESGIQQLAVYEEAQTFLRLLQKHPDETRLHPPAQKRLDASAFDGGFYYSPVIFGANKAGTDPGDSACFLSYASATADGILGLLAAGVAPADARVRAAQEWLNRHPALSFPEGIPEDHSMQWRRVMKLYHWSARMEALAALHEITPELRVAALHSIADVRNPEGFFANPDGGPNKENDPLVATPLALTGLLGLL